MKPRALSFGIAIALVAGLALVAHADMSAKVIKAFKGQIIVSAGPLQSGATDKETVAAYKAQRLAKVVGAENGDDVQAWTFHYTAFLKNKGAQALTLRFYKGKSDDYCADHHLSGVDPSATVIEMDLSISEDDGPTKGKDYRLELVNDDDVVVASTTLRLE